MGVIRLALRLAIAGALIFGATLIAVLWQEQRLEAVRTASQSVPAPPPDLIIALGGGPRASSERSARIENYPRLLHAVDLSRDLPDVPVILMGGGGDGARDETLAGIMRRHVLAAGVPEARLRSEPSPRTTFGEMRLASAIISAEGFSRPLIITDAVHMTRAGVLWRFFSTTEADISVAPPARFRTWVGRTLYRLREAAAWWYNLGKVGVWCGLGLLGLDETDRAAWVA